MTTINRNLKGWMSFAVLSVVIVGVAIYYTFFFTPKDSLELYQTISFSDDFDEAQKVMLKGYESNFKKEDFDFISDLKNSPNRISQFSLFEYNQKTYLVLTTPGTKRLKVLAVEELPKEIEQYFLEVTPK
ncbi:hypothetical protein QTL97_09710 [Sporosarcina thermotolerans]|uniref:DUF3139 domain-containing protein n=1 Tax=Sporosarcina thermotolerans TaxID=633404 RepID=A0AAW9ADJ7_9BACL|nr:hypothetical protein [Sporosarcina thermotolerans]MDW0117213.1 hypothetical protein [Sporosarcina thermotolerans]WHT47384.1 hypothetical protein QNH10_14425 [Sporosarcina thermotolerans]